jgi:hypothetical protein
MTKDEGMTKPECLAPKGTSAIRIIRADPSTLQRRMKKSAEDSGRYNRRFFLDQEKRNRGKFLRFCFPY